MRKSKSLVDQLYSAEGRRSTFSSTTVFRNATFSSTADFGGTTFSGDASFVQVDFGTETISFVRPKQWGPPAPVVDWALDISQKPANVEPQDWPPTVVSAPVGAPPKSVENRSFTRHPAAP
ncbi:pentapeptide repeat-containing protein, partial [Nocardia xishanensis]|uniref:pentapeptide repeat-containing protein n=1 Tax=Nocardia xishanensis TaxID=238964 RepID=UPI001470E93B